MRVADSQLAAPPAPGTGHENSVVHVFPPSRDPPTDLGSWPAPGSPAQTAIRVPPGATDSATEDASISQGIWRTDQVAPPSSVDHSGAMSSTPSPLVAGVETTYAAS